MDHYFTENQISVQTEIEIGSMDFLIEFSKIGLGVAAVIKEFVEEDLERGLLIEILFDPLPPKRTIGVITHNLWEI